MSEIKTVTEITETSTMQKKFNEGFAIKYINDRLPSSAHLDIRKSYWFYDSDKDLVDFALSEKLNDDVLPILYEKSNGKICYWSKGVV